MWLEAVVPVLTFGIGAGVMALGRRHLKLEIERLNRLLELTRAALRQSERLR